MKEYMIACAVQNIPCVVIGFGMVGKRKVAGLIEAGAENIKIIDIIQYSEIPHPAHFFCREHTDEDIQRATLVFATTSNASVNEYIAKQCAKYGKLCLVSSSSQGGTFANVSKYSTTEYSIGVTTKGNSPVFGMYMRSMLATHCTQNTVALSLYIRSLRRMMQALHCSSDRMKSVLSNIIKEEQYTDFYFVSAEDVFKRAKIYFTIDQHSGVYKTIIEVLAILQDN